MEEKLEECIYDDMNEPMRQNNVSNVLQLETLEVIYEKMTDNTFLESAKRKTDELNSQIQDRKYVITTINNKHLEYDKQVNEINQKIKTISAHADALNNKLENFFSHVHQLKRTLRNCSSLKQKIDFANNKILTNINHFNAEMRNTQITYTDEIKELELMLIKQDEDYNNSNKFEKHKELEQDENIIVAQLKEWENNINSLETASQPDAPGKKYEVMVKNTEMKKKVDLKTKEFDMEDLQIHLQKKKDRSNVIEQESQQAQLELDEQSTRMNCVKGTQSNYEKLALELEQEYSDLECHSASLKEANEKDLSEVQFKNFVRMLWKKNV